MRVAASTKIKINFSLDRLGLEMMETSAWQLQLACQSSFRAPKHQGVCDSSLEAFDSIHEIAKTDPRENARQLILWAKEKKLLKSD